MRKPIRSVRTYQRRSCVDYWIGEGQFDWLCPGGPEEWFELPLGLSELDLVVSTSRAEGYQLVRPEGLAWRIEGYCPKLNDDVETVFYPALDAWFSRVAKRAGGAPLYLSVEYSPIFIVHSPVPDPAIMEKLK